MSRDSITNVLVIHDISKDDHFLMKLQSDHENTCTNLINHHPLPALDVCFSELIHEEHLLTHTTPAHEKLTTLMVFGSQKRQR